MEKKPLPGLLRKSSSSHKNNSNGFLFLFSAYNNVLQAHPGQVITEQRLCGPCVTPWGMVSLRGLPGMGRLPLIFNLPRTDLVMQAKKDHSFRQSLLDPQEFTVTLELVPSRGGHSKEHTRILDLAEKLACDQRIRAVSITENAGGHAALSPEVLGLEIQKNGLEVIVHFSSKDKNRNQMESLLFAWDRLGIRDLLVISGDYPQEGYRGYAKPVFDLDSVHVLDLLSRMNRGDFGGSRFSSAIHPTSFFLGVALSPFKRLEAELLMQYYKLHRKAACGADYIITQVGFDARKFQEVLFYLQANDLDLPAIGNVFVPSLKVAELMHQGKIPGCIIPDRLYAEILREARSPDKGKKSRLIRAAKLLAILKGLGYAGAHLGGPGLNYEDIDFLLTTAETFLPAWQELVAEMNHWLDHGFYLFTRDEKTGLNTREMTRTSANRTRFLPHYRLAKAIHTLAFTPTGPLHGAGEKICLALEESRLENGLTRMEHMLKFLLFDCRNCGDCTLHELAFVCAQSGCAKYLLNGPCGGSRDGWCEVYPGKKRCLYVCIYERLTSQNLGETMKKGFVPPRNWALNNTSSWLNYYQGRDHTGTRSP